MLSSFKGKVKNATKINKYSTMKTEDTEAFGR